MIANECWLMVKFQEYNHDYFNDKLEFPYFVIRHSYRTLGYFHCELDEYGTILSPTIEMSDNYEYTEGQFRDILVHEMIHYYLVLNGKDRKCRHGKEFKRMADDFNIRYGMNITSTIDLTPYNIAKGKSNFMFKLFTLF